MCVVVCGVCTGSGSPAGGACCSLHWLTGAYSVWARAMFEKRVMERFGPPAPQRTSSFYKPRAAGVVGWTGLHVFGGGAWEERGSAAIYIDTY